MRPCVIQLFIALAALLALPLGGTQQAQARTDPKPRQLDGVGVDEQLEAQVPTDLAFRDDGGREVALGDYFGKGKPLLLTLNYSDCPMLCSVQLNALVASLKDLTWTAGGKFEMVTVSLDPEETPESSAGAKASYLEEYGRPAAAEGWHFLSGPVENIRSLAETVGFGYRRHPETGEYLHPAAVIVLTPEGRISRYLAGLDYEPRDVRLALLEASEGKIGNVVDQVYLYCFKYDSSEGRYAPVAMRIMQVSGGLTAVVLGLFLGGFWLRESRKNASEE